MTFFKKSINSIQHINRKKRQNSNNQNSQKAFDKMQDSFMKNKNIETLEIEGYFLNLAIFIF